MLVQHRGMEGKKPEGLSGEVTNQHPYKNMDFPEVNKKLLGELEEMGFPLARATRALHYSGNSSLLDAISWIVDHEDDPEIDQMPLVPLRIEIEGSDSSSSVSQEVKLKAQKLRDKARKRNKEENMKLEPSREKERIRAGKELQEAKRIADENERKRSIALRKAEKEEENRARERIRQKLHQDKVERRGGIQSHASLKTTIPVVQENKISPVITSTRISVNSTTKMDLMRDCLRSLRRNNKENDMKVKRAFETLLIYVRNVARNPNEDKFRKIRLSNPAFKERVGIFEEGVKFLEVCGFKRAEGVCYNKSIFWTFINPKIIMTHSTVSHILGGYIWSIKELRNVGEMHQICSTHL
ncbi:unnamed protein product [Lactuca saligna]|uniref:UBA domain-containing protein n=1 Tax=Lactuca saligna TaxID=75948 RepID=A0AA36EKU4_LACSI|nr:unnamed protein product [Lactuca saligna]